MISMSQKPTHPEPVAYDAYQKLADAYADLIDTKPHNAFYDRPAMLSLIPNIDGKHVLDAGCGPGAYAQEFVSRGARVTGIDVSDHMLARATQRLEKEISANRVQLHQVDVSQPLSMFGAESFDLVNAALCLDYVEDWRSVFREFYRLLNPNGKVVFSCGHPAFEAEYYQTSQYFSVEPVECLWKGFGIEIQMPSFRRSLEEITTPVIQAGFVLEKIHEPLPTEDFRKADPIRYRRLLHRPGFLCIRARKIGGTTE
jgi:SAM-dependent methyltransferase